jgi:hypothetical protein
MKQKSNNKIVLKLIMLVFGFVLTATIAHAQLPTSIDTSKMVYNEISTKVKLFVFPTKGQSQGQQKKDEWECYNWAVKNSGVDPYNPQKVAAAPVESGPDGTAVKSAAKGALVGTAIGAVTGDTGQGAAVGAIAGGAAGMRQKKVTQQQQQQQAAATASKTEQDMLNSFNKAFSACIEGKGYTIK